MRRCYSLVVTCALLVCSLGCAVRSKPILVTGNVAVFESLAAIQDTADSLRTANVITAEQRKEIASKLLPALETGRALAKLTATWPEGQPAPAELSTLVTQLRALVDAIVGAWPPSPGRDALALKLNIAQSAALALIAIFVR